MPAGTPDAPASAPATGVNAPVVRRIFGGISLAIGAALLSACVSMRGWFAPAPTIDSPRGDEWAPLVMPFFLAMAWAWSYAGYRVLTRPPLHRRRTVLVWFAVLAVCLVLRSAFAGAT